MVLETANTTYALISDDSAGPRDLGRGPKIGLVLFCAAGIFACIFCIAPGSFALLKPASSADKVSSTHVSETATLPQQMTFGLVSDFQGTTDEYFIEPGGRLVASIEPGSNTTVFLLDRRLQYIIDGEIYITDGAGQKFLGKAGDIFYLPYGSQVTYYTPKVASTYAVVVDKLSPILESQFSSLEPATYKNWVNESARTTQISYFPNMKDRKASSFEAYAKELSPSTSSAFFDELGCFKWNGTELPSGMKPSWNLCCGVFYLKAGPSFTSGKYKHHYEIDLVLNGELQYHLSSGQVHIVKQGGLVHNPRQGDVTIDTPDFGKFLTISLSDADDFYR
jgi:ethanolamine utilization protein EutQ (cupin superfamily)